MYTLFTIYIIINYIIYIIINYKYNDIIINIGLLQQRYCTNGSIIPFSPLDMSKHLLSHKVYTNSRWFVIIRALWLRYIQLHWQIEESISNKNANLINLYSFTTSFIYNIVHESRASVESRIVWRKLYREKRTTPTRVADASIHATLYLTLFSSVVVPTYPLRRTARERSSLRRAARPSFPYVWEGFFFWDAKMVFTLLV